MSFGVNPSRINRPIQAASPDFGRGVLVNSVSQVSKNNLASGFGRPSVNVGVNFTLNPKLALYMGANNNNASGSGEGGNGNSAPPSGNNNNGGGNRRPHRNQGRRNPSPSFQLEESSPLPVEWSTGLPSGLLYNPVQPGKSGFSPLYLSHGKLFPGTEGTTHSTFVEGILDNEIFQKYKEEVAKNNTITSARFFKKEDFIQYLRLISKCLQVYYSVDSVLTLYSNKELVNTGIDSMRLRIDEHAASTFMQLKFELEKHFAPPRLVEFIRAAYQGYTTSLEKNAPIIKLSYMTLWQQAEDDACIEGSIESNIMDDLVVELNSTKFSDLRTIYSEALPDHKIDLKASFNTPIISHNFTTMWHNQSVNYYALNGEDKFHNTNNITDESSFNYYTNQDDLDASWFAMKTVYNNGKQTAGLWRPITYTHNSSPTNYLSVSRLEDLTFRNNMTDQLTSACGIAKIPIYDGVNKVFNITDRPGLGFKTTLFCTQEMVNLAEQAVTRYIFNMKTGMLNKLTKEVENS
jgi:hypothetical protein